MAPWCSLSILQDVLLIRRRHPLMGLLMGCLTSAEPMKNLGILGILGIMIMENEYITHLGSGMMDESNFV